MPNVWQDLPPVSPHQPARLPQPVPNKGPVYNPFNALNGEILGKTPDLDAWFNRPQPDQQLPLPPDFLLPLDTTRQEGLWDERGHHFLTYMEKVRKLALDAGLNQQRSADFFNPLRRLM